MVVSKLRRDGGLPYYYWCWCFVLYIWDKSSITSLSIQDLFFSAADAVLSVKFKELDWTTKWNHYEYFVTRMNFHLTWLMILGVSSTNLVERITFARVDSDILMQLLPLMTTKSNITYNDTYIVSFYHTIINNKKYV